MAYFWGILAVQGKNWWYPECMEYASVCTTSHGIKLIV